MKHISFLLITVLFLSCGKKIPDNITEIHIQVENVKEELDISPLFEDSVDIIPLETVSECLISEIQKIECRNRLIYASDEAGQTVYVFDEKGKYVRSIGRKGNGPGEYSELGDFIFAGDSILIKDKFQDRILVYDSTGNFLSYIALKDIPSVEFTGVDNRIYFIINHEKSELGHYNVIAFDLKTQDYHTYLPYDKNTPLPWGLSNYIGSYKNRTLFIQARDSHIYRIINGTVVPEYVVTFSKDCIPPHYLKNMNGEEVLTEAMKNGYITGINSIVNSRDRLFLSYSAGMRTEVLYDINRHETSICYRFIIKDMGELYVNRFQTADNDSFFIIQDAEIFITAWEKIYRNRYFKNENIKNKMNELYSKIREDDNPVIFKLKFKNVN
ncbi:MAG: 6-bladed beta-propeller [Prevotellaceae bacterium]|jgi:hypothetical protein|nr:6-bladed beta-propeller [Prevotellaceae bacterium]